MPGIAAANFKFGFQDQNFKFGFQAQISGFENCRARQRQLRIGTAPDSGRNGKVPGSAAAF
jgi:hypothetical protein